MLKCDCCCRVFSEDDVAHKPSVIRIHGIDEDDSEDVCPYCHSDEIYDYEEEPGNEE